MVAKAVAWLPLEFGLVFNNTRGTVLIFFSSHSVFLTAEKPARKRYM